MPNLTGVIARPALGVRVGVVELRDLLAAGREVRGGAHLVPGGRGPVGVPHRLAVRRGLPLDVEVAATQVGRVEPEQRGAAAEDVLHHQHPLRAAEPAERGLRGLVGARDPAVHADVGDPVGVVDVAQRSREHRLGEVQAPPPVRGEGGVESRDPAVIVEPDAPLGVEAVPLAGHGEVLGAVQPQPYRSSGQARADGGDRGEAVWLHLLAAEAATHAQALHRHLVVGQPEDVRHDLLRLGGVLGAALDEDLAALVDQRQRGVGLEVEVLLAGELELAVEHVAGARQGGVDVAALHGRLGALEARRRRSPRAG